MKESGGWIGRAPDCDIVIDDPARVVSSRHAHIEWDDQGFAILDQSINGTSVNDVRLVKDRRTALRPGDVIALGGWRVAVATPQTRAAASPSLFDLTLSDLVGPGAPPEPARAPPIPPSPSFPPPQALSLPSSSPEVTPDVFLPAQAPSLPDPLAAFWRGLGVAPSGAASPALMEELGLALRHAWGEAARQAASNSIDGPLNQGPRAAFETDARGVADAMRAALGLSAAREAALHGAVEQAAAQMAEMLSARAIGERLAGTLRHGWFRSRQAELWRQFEALDGELREAAENRFRKDLKARLRGEPRLLSWAGSPRISP